MAMPSSASTGSSPVMPASPCCRPQRARSWAPFLKPTIAANSHLLTDGFAGYRVAAADLGEYFKHTPVIQGQRANAGEFFPIIHTLFSNIKAWLVGTHRGVSAKHLPRYLREWSYRFNRRNLPDGLDRYLIRRAVECATIHWLEELLSAYGNDRVLGVGGHIESLWRNPCPWWFPHERNWIIGCTYRGMRVHNGQIRKMMGANKSARADVLRGSGGFAGQLGRIGGGKGSANTYDDTEFCIRAARLYGGVWVHQPKSEG
jgi:hypothetical protein